MIGNYHLAGRKLFGKIQDKKVFIIGRDTEVRYKSNAKTNTGQVNEQIITGKFNFRYQVQMAFLEDLVQEFTGGAFAVQHHDRVF